MLLNHSLVAAGKCFVKPKVLLFIFKGITLYYYLFF